MINNSFTASQAFPGLGTSNFGAAQSNWGPAYNQPFAVSGATFPGMQAFPGLHHTQDINA
jgi:hypothetical protein